RARGGAQQRRERGVPGRAPAERAGRPGRLLVQGGDRGRDQGGARHARVRGRDRDQGEDRRAAGGLPQGVRADVRGGGAGAAAEAAAVAEPEAIEAEAPQPESEPEAEPEDELTVAKRERDEYLDLAKRTQADFENFRKRSMKDAANAGTRARIGLIREILPVV